MELGASITNKVVRGAVTGALGSLSVKLKEVKLTEAHLKNLTDYLKGENLSDDDVRRIAGNLREALKNSPPDKEFVVDYYDDPEKIADWLIGKALLDGRLNEPKLARKFITELFQALITLPSYHNEIAPLLAQWQQKATREILERTQGIEQTANVLVARFDEVIDAAKAKNSNFKVFGPKIERPGVFFDPEHRLRALATAIQTEAGGNRVSLTQAVKGMGGIGKTTLAQQFAHEYRDQFTGLWWVNAEDESSLIGGLAALTNEVLGPPKPNSSETDPEARARAAMKYLDTQEASWLLIYDNVESKALIKHWLPSGKCACLITSRITTWDGATQSLALTVWSAIEGAAYLRDERGIPGASAQLEGLVEELEGLPLAVDHAASYLKNSPLESIADYRAGLAKKLGDYPEGSSYPRSVFATFKQALEAIQKEEHGKAAQDWLDLLAHLGPEPISGELMRELGAFCEFEFKALGLLTTRSLVLQSEESSYFYLHRVVAEVARTLQGEAWVSKRDQVLLWLKHASGGLDPRDPKDAAGYAEITPLIRHQLGAFDEDKPTSEEAREAHWLILNRLGNFERLIRGNYREAEQYFQKNLTLVKRDLPPTHPDYAVALNNVASNLDDQGRYEAAEPLHKKGLEIFRAALGENHPDTASSYNNVAYNLNAQGRYEEAEPLVKKALEIRRVALGENHPDTATSYNNVAYNLNDQGRYEAAEPLYLKSLEISRAALGENHPYTATSYNNVAFNLNAQGRYEAAEPLYKKGLEIRREALGENHPYTASSYNNVAANLNAQGRYEEAEPLYKKGLEIWREALGENHPYTASSYNNVAANLNAQGRYEEAEPLYKKGLEIWRKALGENHPYTASSYNNVAGNLNAQGRYEEAEPLYKKGLEIWREALGENHPSTATSYNNVAYNLNDQGRYEAAEPLFKKGLEIRREALGENNPDTASSYNNVASNLYRQNRLAEAEEPLAKALAIFQNSLPAEHPHIKLVKDNLEALRAKIVGDK